MEDMGLSVSKDRARMGIYISVVVVIAPHPASTGGWAAERAPGYFPPGTLCGVCVDLYERRVPQEGYAVPRVRPQLAQ